MKLVHVRQSTQNIHSKNTFYLVLYNIEVYATIVTIQACHHWELVNYLLILPKRLNG